MNLSELQSKDVINIYDGKCIGNIVDVSIDDSGKPVVFMVEKYKFFLSLFKNSTREIRWSQINKIGKDVILVDIK